MLLESYINFEEKIMRNTGVVAGHFKKLKPKHIRDVCKMHLEHIIRLVRVDDQYQTAQ